MFITNSTNIRVMSSGTRLVKRAEVKRINFPAIMPNNSCTEMFYEYRACRQEFPFGGGLEAIIQIYIFVHGGEDHEDSVLYQILRWLYQWKLLYDNIRLIKKTMNTEMEDVVHRKKLHKQLDAVFILAIHWCLHCNSKSDYYYVVLHHDGDGNNGHCPFSQCWLPPA